jgi:hypothetical protein
VSNLHQRAFLLLGVALICSLAACWSFRRELLAAREDLAAVNTANEFLKKTLGDMTVAIAAKEREIDHLEGAVCDGREKAQPRIPVKPRPAIPGGRRRGGGTAPPNG